MLESPGDRSRGKNEKNGKPCGNKPVKEIFSRSEPLYLQVEAKLHILIYCHSMEKQNIIICRHFGQELAEALRGGYDRVFVLTDEYTYRHCLPRLKTAEGLPEVTEITIGAGDEHKDLQTLAKVWQALSEGGASRRSVLINLGGGMVTDLGGFAAATFKRGIACINVPTTLLAMVDAAVGGKTGINFCGLKNEIGAFAPATCVLLDTEFLRTLDIPNFFSGYAEMLKHGLISTPAHLAELLAFDTATVDYGRLKTMVAESVQVKENIVEQDPHEQGLRKALNLGHTVGHAFESLALAEGRPVLHGYAVAWGLVAELYLSYIKVGFPKDVLRRVVAFVRENYGIFSFDCDRYDRLYALMTHDKKNVGGIINFTLLKDVGEIALDQTADRSTIFEALDFYRECMGG